MEKDIQALWRAMGRAEQLEQVDAVLAGNPNAAANLLSDWKLFRKDCDNKKIPDDLIVAQALALKDKVLKTASSCYIIQLFIKRIQYE